MAEKHFQSNGKNLENTLILLGNFEFKNKYIKDYSERKDITNGYVDGFE